MPFVILAAIIIIALIAFTAYRLFDNHRTDAWNVDPDQKQFIQLFIAAGKSKNSMALMNFVDRQGWGGKETRHRVRHALDVIYRTAEPDVAQTAKDIGWSLSEASYSWG